VRKIYQNEGIGQRGAKEKGVTGTEKKETPGPLLKTGVPERRGHQRKNDCKSKMKKKTGVDIKNRPKNGTCRKTLVRKKREEKSKKRSLLQKTRLEIEKTAASRGEL